MEKLDFLIEYLLKEENHSIETLPESKQEKKNLYRALVNVREPNPISEEFLKKEDEYLQDELKEKNITNIEDIKTIREKYQSFSVKNSDKICLWKGDITKFFYSIDREVLFKIIKKYYKDKKFLRLTEKFINVVPDNEVIPGRGLPIGNYTSQYFANIYLNELDHYIKEELKIKYYVRFMDDGLLFVDNKSKAKEILDKINEFVEKKLHLKLNNKSGYFPTRKGVIFCGYKIYLHTLKIKRANIRRVQKRIKHWNKEWRKRKI